MIDYKSTGVNIDNNVFTFVIQDGPIKENGINGCDLTEMLLIYKLLIEKFNKACYCVENEMTIRHLNKAIYWQERRTEDRLVRNVEGTSKL